MATPAPALKRVDPVLRVFPTPALLSMPSAGLEISEHSLKHLSFSGHQGRLKLRSYGNSDLPSGLIVRGEIVDVEGLSRELKNFLPQVGTKYVHISLPEQKGYVFRMLIPKSGDLSVREAIEFRIEEHVPLPPSDIVFDWEVLPTESTETEHALNITAFPRSTIEMYYAAVSEAGFVPLSFEIESQAAARAVVTPGDTNAQMIVDFGETRTAIAVVEGGVVRFTTSLELAGGSLAAALKKSLGVSGAEAERLKNEEGIAGLGDGNKTAEALMNITAALRDEINRHFVYWHTHGESSGAKHLPITAVVLCGGNANLRGLPEYLMQTMHVSVRIAEVWQNAFSFGAYIPPIPHNHSLRFATVIGLALRRST